MRAGLLKKRITIEAYADDTDSFGDVVGSWTTYAADLPATITPLRGLELERNSVVDTELTHRVVIRHSPDVSAVSPKHRLVYDGRVFDIQSVINVAERDRMIEMMCIER